MTLMLKLLSLNSAFLKSFYLGLLATWTLFCGPDLSLFSNKALADWSPEAKRELLKLQGHIPPEINAGAPNFITFWGGARRQFQAGSLRGEDFKVKLKGFKNKIKLYAHKSEPGSDLLIFLPGIFGTHEDSLSVWVLNHFENSGFHVGSIPNFLSEEYVAAGANYTRENALSLDPSAAVEAIEKIVQRVGAKGIKNIILLGESLGAHLLGRLASQDIPARIGSKLKKAIFLWPPLDVGDSLSVFDKRASASKKDYDSCHYIFRLPLFFKYFWWQDTPSGMESVDRRCFGAYLFHGAFLESMEDVFKVYAQNSKAQNSQGENAQEPPKSFSSFVQLYNPYFAKALKENKRDLKLSYWLGKWEKKEGVDLKIASSVDDFINDKNEWSSIKNKFLFDWGEHCAPISLPGFMKILTKEAQ